MREAGDGAGDDGPVHGEGQHGVDDKHDEEEEGDLEKGNAESRSTQWNRFNPFNPFSAFSINAGYGLRLVWL